MAGQGGLSIREIARRVGRDVKAVHGDVRALIEAGLLDRDAAGLGACAPHRVAALTRHTRRGRPMATPEKTVTLSLASRDETTARPLAAFRGEAQGARISFACVELH